MVNQPTTDELEQVLQEFYQRVIAEKRDRPPPPPIEVQVTTQSFPAKSVEHRYRRPKQDPPQTSALVGQEDQYKLVEDAFIGAGFTYPNFALRMGLNMHDAGRVSDPVYIIVLLATWTSTQGPPGNGVMSIGFDRSTWVPPRPDQPPIEPIATFVPVGMPVTVTGYNVKVQFAILHSDSSFGTYATALFTGPPPPNVSGTWTAFPGNPAFVEGDFPVSPIPITPTIPRQG